MEARLRNIFLLLIVTFCASFAFAEGTRTWKQSTFDELTKGTAKGVAVRSAGGLELAPTFKALVTTPSTQIWAIASDSAGNVFAAAGSPARVYRITPDGQATPIFEPQELQVQTLVVAKSGVVYAATNPDGKVYRIEPRPTTVAGASKGTQAAAKPAAGSWSASVYFEPGTKYIWDLIEDGAGNLYVATGDKGEIFKVTSSNNSSAFFKSDEAHIRVLALDSQGNLIAGSDGSGLIYRISPSGDGFVLYSAPKREITALAIDKAGNIYAAGAGEKRPGAPAANFPATMMPSAPAPVSPAGGGQQPPPGGQATIILGPPSTVTRFPGQSSVTVAGGSEIYRIAPDGSPTRIWSSRDDLVYALAFDAHGSLLAGTGNQGNIFSISGEDQYSALAEASATQVTSFAPAPGNGLYVSTSNLGKLFLLGAGPESEGTYESDVFDAQIFSRWGRLELRSAGSVELFTRSGNVDNPDRHWSSWAKVDLLKEASVTSPPARFLQWKATLRNAANPARLESVTLNYLPKNVAPDFDDVTVQSGVHYQPLMKSVGDMTINIGGNNPSQPKFEPLPPMVRDPDSIGVRWSVHDENDDQMVYAVYYRGDGESRWLLLKDDLTDKFYSFDASLLPDGGYTVKVVASDAPSHSPGTALSSERESARFEVDSTPPQIVNFSATLDAGKIHATFRAVDSFSPIKHAEYSVDAGEWQFLEPVGQLSDAKTENYDFLAIVPPTSEKAPKDIVSAGVEHVVVVRIYDRYENMAAAKTVIRAK